GKEGAEPVTRPERPQRPCEDRAAVVPRPELVAGAVVELEEPLVINQEARCLQESITEERTTPRVSLVVVEVVEPFLVEKACRPVRRGEVQEGELAAEDRLAERRLSARPGGKLPAVDLLDSDFEAAAGVLVDEWAGH